MGAERVDYYSEEEYGANKCTKCGKDFGGYWLLRSMKKSLDSEKSP